MSDRRNKREKEQLFNMPEIAKLEKKSFSGAIEKLEDSKLKKVLIWVFAITVTLIFAVLTSMMLFVFRTNASDDAALHIRRVIGLPGETIQIVNGRILINGETYKEGKDFPTINNPGMAANAITLEAGEYFVLGDNRNNSEDSRYGDIGRVNKKYITGKLWFQISPKKDIGPLNN